MMAIVNEHSSRIWMEIDWEVQKDEKKSLILVINQLLLEYF